MVQAVRHSAPAVWLSRSAGGGFSSASMMTAKAKPKPSLLPTTIISPSLSPLYSCFDIVNEPRQHYTPAKLGEQERIPWSDD